MFNPYTTPPRGPDRPAVTERLEQLARDAARERERIPPMPGDVPPAEADSERLARLLEQAGRDYTVETAREPSVYYIGRHEFNKLQREANRPLRPCFVRTKRDRQWQPVDLTFWGKPVKVASMHSMIGVGSEQL